MIPRTRRRTAQVVWEAQLGVTLGLKSFAAREKLEAMDLTLGMDEGFELLRKGGAQSVDSRSFTFQPAATVQSGTAWLQSSSHT